VNEAGKDLCLFPDGTDTLATSDEFVDEKSLMDSKKQQTKTKKGNSTSRTHRSERIAGQGKDGMGGNASCTCCCR
jgi:hypothetical protein